jgi:predicted nucleic acid-binding protein
MHVLETFQAQRDGRLSFTDAAIVTVARRHDATRIATFDADFRAVDGLEIVPG